MFPGFRRQHEDPFGRDTEENGLRRVLARLFREREILIRSDGKVRFLRLSPRTQAATFAILVAGVIWSATAVPVTIKQGFDNSTNSAQILEAKLAYEDLVAEISKYQESVDEVRGALAESRETLASQIAAAEAVESGYAGVGEAMMGPRAAVRQSRQAMQDHLQRVNATLAQIAGDGVELESMVAKVRADLADSEDGSTLVSRARARLQERAESLEARLATLSEMKLTIESQNAELSSSLKMTTAERDGLAEQRVSLSSRIAALEIELAALQEEEARVEEHNGDLTARLEASVDENGGLVDERDGLQEQVAALDNELQLSRSETSTLKDDLREVALGLQKATGDVAEVEGTRLALRTHVDGLLAELSNQRAAGEVVLQRATERAASSVEGIMKVVAMTGLNADTLLARAQVHQAGQGGPFIPESGALPADEELARTMLTLETNMSRWEAMKEVLRALPLTLPVDYYHITSLYGPRSDPVNNRRSRHTGLDMAGWLKTSIWAAAPGRVVYSGRKGRYGIVVEIDHGFGILTRYAHLNRALVEVGEIVEHRQRIALLGSTGRSTGPHLHYEIRFDGKPLNPMNFIKAGRYVFKN